MEKVTNIESFDASRFMKKNFEKVNVFGERNLFQMLGGINTNNILLLAQVSIDNPVACLQYDNLESVITEKQQKIDFLKIYMQHPSQVSRKDQHYLEASESELFKADKPGSDFTNVKKFYNLRLITPIS